MTTANSCVLGVLVLAGLIGHAIAASEHTIDSARLANSIVRYRDQSQLSEFPAPVVYFRAARGRGVAHAMIAGRQAAVETSSACFPRS